MDSVAVSLVTDWPYISNTDVYQSDARVLNALWFAIAGKSNAILFGKDNEFDIRFWLDFLDNRKH